MGRPKKDSSYRAAIERLRSEHSDKIEEIFLEMYHISRGQDKNGGDISVEDKDRVNAAKVCVSLLGVPRTATEKPPPRDGGNTPMGEKPTLSKEHAKVLDDILGKL
jgi:hypothetical protein